jgi:periplasmic divalent cation tolerance protein
MGCPSPFTRPPSPLAAPSAEPHFGCPPQPLERVTLNAYASVYVMAISTTPSVDAGRTLVRELVERRLIACGTVLAGGTSIYRWKDAIEETAEAVLLMKTRVERWDELKQVFPTLHPYDVPELILVPIAGGHKPYLDWLSAET